MNQSTPETPRHRGESLEDLGLQSDNAQLRALWRDAFMQWGERFAAYAQLRPRELHTLDVLDDFSRRFVTDYPDLASAIQAPIGRLVEQEALSEFETAHGLENGTVSWDYDALELFLRSGYDIIERESGVYLFEKRPPLDQQQVIAGLEATTDDPDILARWVEGMERWGNAFLAFASLRLPELHRPDVLLSFEDMYLTTYDTLQEASEFQIEANGWRDALTRLRATEGISEDLLDWDHSAVIRQLEHIYEFVWFGGQVHLFEK